MREGCATPERDERASLPREAAPTLPLDDFVRSAGVLDDFVLCGSVRDDGALDDRAFDDRVRDDCVRDESARSE
jgi:hypothetical protein